MIQHDNIAYIDGANLHKGVAELGWQLNYKKFRIWLRDKYGVHTAYLFLGFLPTQSGLYRDLQRWGHTIIFKPTIPDGTGSVKGNCDAEMVLQAVSDMYENEYGAAVLVTGDGDFACLVRFLKERGRLCALLSPCHAKASLLLRKEMSGDIVFLERMQKRLSRVTSDGVQKKKPR